MEEIEVKVLDINPEEVEKKLLALGAKKISDEVLEEWLFDKQEWRHFSGRVRVRKGKNKIELAYKETTKQTGEGNLEIEFEVSDLEQALEFVKKVGLFLARHQQKRRVHFELEGLSVDIDYWPKLPPYLEVEGKSRKKIEGFIEKLDVDGRRVELDALQIYEQVYGISLGKEKELVF